MFGNCQRYQQGDISRGTYSLVSRGRVTDLLASGNASNAVRVRSSLLSELKVSVQSKFIADDEGVRNSGEVISWSVSSSVLLPQLQLQLQPQSLQK